VHESAKRTASNNGVEIGLVELEGFCDGIRKIRAGCRLVAVYFLSFTRAFEAKASPFRAGMKPTNSIQPPTMA
jgi:hypothetical protein